MSPFSNLALSGQIIREREIAVARQRERIDLMCKDGQCVDDGITALKRMQAAVVTMHLQQKAAVAAADHARPFALGALDGSPIAKN